MGGTPVSNPNLYEQSSPIRFVTATSPPTILFHGALDNLVNVSQAMLLKNKLESLGVSNQLVIYPNEGHGLWPDPIMNDVYSKIETFIKANVQ